MTQSHIKFEPLILPRKTPAEELRKFTEKYAESLAAPSPTTETGE